MITRISLSFRYWYVLKDHIFRFLLTCRKTSAAYMKDVINDLHVGVCVCLCTRMCACGCVLRESVCKNCVCACVCVLNKIPDGYTGQADVSLWGPAEVDGVPVQTDVLQRVPDVVEVFQIAERVLVHHLNVVTLQKRHIMRCRNTAMGLLKLY